MDDLEIEQLIKEKGLNAPRVTLAELNGVVKSVEIVKHICSGGGILRWAVLNVENGFSVTGDPSACVSPENDDAELGEKIAIKNAEHNLWKLEGYKLKQQIFEEKEKDDDAKYSHPDRYDAKI